MDFHRLLGGSELGRDLLVEPTGDDALEHLSLARRQGGNARVDRLALGLRFVRGAILFHCRPHGGESRFRENFCQGIQRCDNF